MYDVETSTALLRVRLSKKRFRHSVNVAETAEKLAVLYGADREAAYYAGLMHDSCKELPRDEQEALMLEGDFQPCREELLSPKLWHGIAAARFLQTSMDVSDRDLLHAVRFHTVARGGMSLLEKIVYLSDLVSPDRSYNDVDAMRKLTFSDLDAAMREALIFVVGDQIKKGGFLIPYTVDAYNEYIAQDRQMKASADRKRNGTKEK